MYLPLLLTGTAVLFVFGYFFILTGYIFLPILAFCSIHHITAFSFYMTHDYNRTKGGYLNCFYALISRVPIRVMLLTPVLGILIAYLVRASTEKLTFGFSIIVLICMAHFSLKNVMWKRGSPHRQFVRVK